MNKPKEEIIRRAAERGLKMATSYYPEGYSPAEEFVDIFQHILDELERDYE